MSAIVIVWTFLKVAAIGQQAIQWPGLHKMISITLYHDKPYAAIWNFQPLATGTAILVAAIITAALVKLSPAGFVRCIGHTTRQAWLAIITVMLIVGLAYLMNYSGLAYTLGEGGRLGRTSVHPVLALPRLARGLPVRQRYLRQCPVR